MSNLSFQRATHAQKLERWLGAEQVEHMSKELHEWYGPPIPLGNVPGTIYARKNGEFVGAIQGGGFGNLTDFYWERIKRISRNVARRQQATCNIGFSSVSDLISEATTNGKLQRLGYCKLITNGVAQNRSLWGQDGYPTIGATPTARAAGDIPTSTTIGALRQVEPSGTDTSFLTSFDSNTAAGGVSLLILYDRLYEASAIAHTNNASQTITGVIDRYSSTSTSPGNFFFLEVTNTLGATAHTVLINYTDNSNNAAENSGTTTVVVSSTANRIPHAQFFVPINDADTGIKGITALTFSAVSSGTSNAVLGHVLSMLPQPTATTGSIVDGINSAFNMIQIQNNACLAFLDLRTATGTGANSGTVCIVSG